MLHFMVSPHSRMCSVTIAKDTLQRQLSIVVAAFCLANEWKAGGGLRIWSLSSNLVRFIALFTDCLHLEGGLSLPVLHGAAKLRHPAVCRHWQNLPLGHQSHCPCRIL